MNPYLKSGDTQLDHLDLIKYLLHRIIWILLSGVICAGLAWMFQSHTVRKSVLNAERETNNAVESETESETESDTGAYKLRSSLIGMSKEEIQELLSEEEHYLENAPYMQLDPTHVWRTRVVVRVESKSQKHPAYQIEELYRFNLIDGDFLQEYAEKNEMDVHYLKELTSVWLITATDSSDSGASDVVVHEGKDDEWTSTEQFCIQAYGSTKELAMELQDMLLDELQVLYEEYAIEYPHAIKIMSKTCLEVYDSGIRNAQKEHVTYTQSLLNLLADFETKSKNLEAKNETEETQELVSEPMSPQKAALIGFAVGVILACIWFTIRYLRNDKLVDYKDIGRQGIYLKELGTISDQGIAMAAASIRNFAKDRKKLFLTGMTSQAEFESACKSLQEYLSEYEIVYVRDVVHDPKSREELVTCDAAVLVEQKAETHYSDMKEEVTFLFDSGKEIIGIIIL